MVLASSLGYPGVLPLSPSPTHILSEISITGLEEGGEVV